MRRRLIVAVVGAVVAALVLAGLGTLALARLGARRYAEKELREQVESIAASMSTDTVLVPRNERPRVLEAIREALGLEGVALIYFGANGGAQGDPPEGVTLDTGDFDALRAGETISGAQGRTVYAGATINRAGTLTAVVLSDRIDIVLGGALLWFVLAGGGVVVIGALVAVRLSKRLTDPLRRAEEASRRIAAGDLAARVPEPSGGARDEVGDLSRSINAMAATLERSRGLEQQFLLSVSHDLRTPLTSIQGYAEALADGTLSDGPGAGTVIAAEARRLDRLVRDLLELARLDARSFRFELANVELHDLVEACVEGFAPEAESAGVTVTVDTMPAVVWGDPDRLAQAVANLLENALKYTRSQVAVRVAVGDGRATLTIDDDGPGIAPDDRPHVFERLYVARHQPVRKESGSGLGLAIVRELVAAMDGTVGAAEGTLGGARLYFSLPLAAAR